MRKHCCHSPGSTRRNSRGSAIIAVLGALALLSLLLVSLLQSVRIERETAAAGAAELQARLAAESGLEAASSLLTHLTSNRPAYLVGLVDDAPSDEIAPATVIGSTNLTSPGQLAPLFSCNPNLLTPFPKLPADLLPSLLKERASTNPAKTIDLNAPLPGAYPGETPPSPGGLLAPEGRYPAIWQRLQDSKGLVVARYAFVLLDESSRLNPLLHRGNPRNDPIDWDKGPGDIALTNGTSTLFTEGEADALRDAAEHLPHDGCFESALGSREAFLAKHSLLTRDPCHSPELIPASLPEGGLPKYNLNDLATNPEWGATPYDRAVTIARIIDRNLPRFKERDPSLPSKQGDLYLKRLACSIVDYISPEPGPIGEPNGEPSGRDLTPYVTQIAERCTRKALTSTNVTIESQFFVEIWNPYTVPIPTGIPGLLIGNRARVDFGTAISFPFADYNQTAAPLPALQPNEFTVVAFAPVEQTWTSPLPSTNPPRWTNGPVGNADGLNQQYFEFRWNGRLTDMSRRPPLSPGNVSGGLSHLGQTLGDATPRWQILTIPTWSSDSDEQPEESEEALQPGSYRFVGDPRSGFLTAYKWSVATNYPAKTLWKGISPAGILGRGYVMDPMNTWTRRDRIPVNPVAGNPPASVEQTPDQITSPYRPETDGITAPFVIRKGPMRSLGELGNIFDPAQADDMGQAPLAGSPKSRFCCGGGRTLRVGQPEFRTTDPAFNWDVPGKRAVELLDLFTVSEEGRQPPGKAVMPREGPPGRINVNTAPHAVLTALFSGITVASDRRFTNCVIPPSTAEDLANEVEKHRPYNRLSDLGVITAKLSDASSYFPPLSRNVPGSSPPLADVFDRAREEAFGKVIGHCCLQTRVFRAVILGEALDRSGKASARALIECLVKLTPDENGRLHASVHDLRWN